jgi:hypothetical protein
MEVIVVDDGSQDETGQVARNAAARDSRVRVIAQPNQGVAAARNTAIAQARGDYIAPLDGASWNCNSLPCVVTQGHNASIAGNSRLTKKIG